MSYEIDNAKCVKDTGKAILVEADDLDEPTWIPQSCITEDSEVYTYDTEGTLIVHEWFAEKRGWL